MAGDWIPMRSDLWDCPQVVRILSAMCPQDVRTVSETVRIKSELIGALFRLWSLFDTYTDDGILQGYDAVTLNQMVGIDDFAENLEAVGWLKIRPNALEMPGFSRHLGQSAKRRMRDAQRKRDSRKSASASCPQNVRSGADKKRTTEQNRTSKKKKQKESAPAVAATSRKRTRRQRDAPRKLITPHQARYRLVKQFGQNEAMEWDDDRCLVAWHEATATEPENGKAPDLPDHADDAAELP